MGCGALLRRSNLGLIRSQLGLINRCHSNFVSGYAASTNTTPQQQASSFSINPFVAIPRTFNSVIHMTSNDWAIKWSQCKIVYYTIMVRYQLGKKLLCADAAITYRLIVKITQGRCLSRRERQLLARATADIFRLVPGSMFLAVPSLQFLLPLILRFYPNILSPSFQDKITGQERVMRKLNARIEYAKFLQETAIEMAKVAQNSPSGHVGPTAEEFIRFWNDIKLDRPVPSEEVFRFARLFSDEHTLDHVSRPAMENMCKSMGIASFGTNEHLHFILSEKLKSIKNNDKLIQLKGVEALSEVEVRKACRERGIHVAEDEQQQLRNWLDLSLNHAVPSSFLIMSRGIIGTKKLKPEEAMQATLSSLPYELIYIVGVASLPSSDPILDKRRKIKALSFHEKAIKEEEENEISETQTAIQNDMDLKEMTAFTPEQASARAVDDQEQLCEVISDALFVLTSLLNVSTECDNLLRLFKNEIILNSSYKGKKGLEGEKEAIKAHGAAQEENIGDTVSSALLNRANGMLQKLEKETDGVGAKISYRWRVLERYCDGKVSLDLVAAATFLKDTLDKEGIQELISNLSKYKEEIEKLGIVAKDIKPRQKGLVHKSGDMNQGRNQLLDSDPTLSY